MLKFIISCLGLCCLSACSTNQLAGSTKEMPSCLETKIKTMSSDPREASPISVTRYTYKKQTVYYMVSQCCDKYNVYDSVCNLVGFPDGGYTGRGDGKMTDFKKEAMDGKVVWEKGKGE